MTISNSTVSGNFARNLGGGIDSENATVTISGTTISNNTVTTLYGGGIYSAGSGTMTISDSTVSGNNARGDSAGFGGGIYNSATLVATNITVSGNSAAGTGFAARGAGIANDKEMTLTNATVVDNTMVSTGFGGGVYSGNFSGVMTKLRNTLVANNTAPQGPDVSGVVTSQGYNLIENPTGATISGITTGNITGQDPKLGPLQITVAQRKPTLSWQAVQQLTRARVPARPPTSADSRVRSTSLRLQMLLEATVQTSVRTKSAPAHLLPLPGSATFPRGCGWKRATTH